MAKPRHQKTSSDRRKSPASTIFSLYIDALVEDAAALRDYPHSELWTHRATRALVQVGVRLFPNAEVTAKKHTHMNWAARSEYLTLDVMLCDQKSTWGPPVFVAEHENTPTIERIQYNAWKLLSVVARTRVLVAYFGPKSASSFEKIAAAAQEVCDDNPGRDVLLIGGLYDATPKSVRELRECHRFVELGARRA